MAEIETLLALKEPEISFRHIRKITHVARGSLFEILMVDDDYCDYRICTSTDGEYCCQVTDPMRSRDIEQNDLDMF